MTGLFSRAESHETAVQLSVASGSLVFEKGLRSLPIAAELFVKAMDSEEVRHSIASRIAELVSLDIDLRFRHPQDIALAIYLWVLDAVDQNVLDGPRYGQIAATVVLLQGRNCSWADRVAHGIRDDAIYNDKNTSVTYGSREPEITVMHAMETRIDVPTPGVLKGATFGAWLVSPERIPEETEYVGDSSNVAPLEDSGAATVLLRAAV